VILIQRIEKIKGSIKQKWIREIIFDIIFYTIFFVLGIIIVFSKIEKGREKPFVIVESQENLLNDSFIPENEVNMSKKYVASSRGKYFYEVGSSRANSLSDKNKLYFSSQEEAKKLGFKPYFEN